MSRKTPHNGNSLLRSYLVWFDGGFVTQNVNCVALIDLVCVSNVRVACII